MRPVCSPDHAAPLSGRPPASHAARLVRCALLGALLLALALPSMAFAGGPAPTRDTWYRASLPRQVAEPPYRTQRDGSRYAGSNCGPAVLGMVLEAYGIDLPTLELRRLTHTYQGTWPGRGGTALQHMARVAQDFGVASHDLYEAPDMFHAWTIDEIVDQVDQGRWVIPLVRYNFLPGHESSPVRWGHYILVYALQDDGFLYHDPAFDPVEEGQGRWISRQQLDRAMGPVPVPRQAVALGG